LRVLASTLKIFSQKIKPNKRKEKYLIIWVECALCALCALCVLYVFSKKIKKKRTKEQRFVSMSFIETNPCPFLSFFLELIIKLVNWF